MVIRTHKIIRASLLALTSLASLPALAGDQLGIPTNQAENISPEMSSLARSISQDAQQSANTLIEAGDMDWIQSLQSQADLSANPLDEQQQAEAVSPTEPTENPNPHPAGDGFKTLIFVSWSMGEAAIKDVLQRYDGQQTTAVVFRGVPDDKPFAQGVMAIQAVSMSSKSSVAVVIDPVAFRTHGVAAVPAIAIETPAGDTQIKATGTVSAEQLAEALKDGKEGDIGSLGPTLEIQEPDMIEVAQQRIEQLDFDAIKQKAISRFWQNNAGNHLPTVQRDIVRRVDPTVLITQDILDAYGNVVTPRGEINPLDIMPFDQKLVVIDPTQQWQVDLAIYEIAATPPGITVTVMASEIPADRGWEVFENTQDAIGAALYMMPAAMGSRFQIQAVPSVVTADRTHFIVEEISKITAEGKPSVQ